MQLKIQRSQRKGGMLGGKVIFALDIRAEYTPEERDSINKYSLGGEVIYSSQASKEHLARVDQHLEAGGANILKGAGSLILARMNLNITIASLAKGQHIECKDLVELIDAENAVCEACKNVKSFLAVAATFDGREVVIDFDEQKLATA